MLTPKYLHSFRKHYKLKVQIRYKKIFLKTYFESYGQEILRISMLSKRKSKEAPLFQDSHDLETNHA